MEHHGPKQGLPWVWGVTRNYPGDLLWAAAPALFVHGEWQELNSSTSPATCGASFPPMLGGLIQVGCGDGSRDAAWLSSQPQHRLCQRWFVLVFAVKLLGFIFQLFPLSAAACSLWERDRVPKHPLKRAVGREALRGASSCSLLPPPNFSPAPAAQIMPATCQLPPAHHGTAWALVPPRTAPLRVSGTWDRAGAAADGPAATQRGCSCMLIAGIFTRYECNCE